MQKVLLTSTILVLCSMPLQAIADARQDCVVGGKVFQDAMQAEMLLIAYGERTDWRRVDYLLLPKRVQERIDRDVAKMRRTSEAIVANVLKDVPDWKKQGMDGDFMARQILLKGQRGLGEQYSVDCLKALQNEETTPSSSNSVDR